MSQFALPVTLTKRIQYALLAVLFALSSSLSVLLFQNTASAATTNSEYVYDFIGQGATDFTVSNTAAANTGVDMTLSSSNWTPTANGIDFSGESNTAASLADDATGVGYANPPGTTPATMVANGSFGISARFTYQRPAANTCGTPAEDVVSGITSNVAQIGRAGSGVSQIKLQIEECTGGVMKPNPQLGCRAAGVNPSTASGQLVVNQNVTLVEGVTYVARCIKSADNGSTAPISILVQPVNQAAATEHSTTIPATGVFNSDKFVSVGNKYSGPEYADQFVGAVAKMAICQHADAAQVALCLDTEVNPSVATGPTELVFNSSVEANLSGWFKLGTNASLVRSSLAAYDGTKSIRVNTTTNGTSSNKVGFVTNPRLVTSTVAGKQYTGSVWVKPGAVGQVINLRLREMAGTSTTQVGGANISSITATTTNWVQIVGIPKVASANGNSINYDVYSENILANQFYYADKMSLTASN